MVATRLARTSEKRSSMGVRSPRCLRSSSRARRSTLGPSGPRGCTTTLPFSLMVKKPRPQLGTE